MQSKNDETIFYLIIKHADISDKMSRPAYLQSQIFLYEL